MTDICVKIYIDENDPANFHARTWGSVGLHLMHSTCVCYLVKKLVTFCTLGP